MSKADKKIRWGIVSAARIAKTFARDIIGIPNASLAAVAARQLVSAEAFASEFSIPKAYGSYDELFADADIDAVYIATPHSHHKEQSIAALRAGKHVLCEKPATVTPAELEEVLAVAEQEGRYYMEAMWTYFLPAIIKCQQWIDEGRIGKLLHVKAEFGFPLPYDPNLRQYNNKLGGGCLLEVGIYPVAMAWLFFKQDAEQLTVWNHNADNGVEDDVVIINRYKDSDTTAQLTTSYRGQLNNYLTLIGDRGTIMVPNFWMAREAKLYKGPDCVDHYSDTRTQQGFNYQIKQVSHELLAGKLQPEIVTWQDSRAFQRQMATIKTKFTNNI